MSDSAILTYFVQNPDQYEPLHHIFQESKFSFESKPLQFLWATMQRCWDKAGRFPSKQEVRAILATARGIKDKPIVLEGLYQATEEIYEGTSDEITKDLILGRILEPQREALADLANRLDVWNFRAQADLIRAKLDDIEILTQKDTGSVHDPFAEDLIDNIAEAFPTYLGDVIPTGWPRIDDWMEGGFRRGELVIPAAMPGDGKTMSCISLGANFARNGYRVYHAVLDNTEEETRAKYWANFIKVPTHRLDVRKFPEMQEEIQRKLAWAKSTYDLKNRITIRKWPRKTKSVKDAIRDMLLQERRRGITYDVFIGDYMDVFKTRNFHKDPRFGYDEVCVDLAAGAEELKKVFISPTQLHRAAKFIEVPDIENLAEAFSKSWHAAVIYMILASRMERINGKARFFFAKTRRRHEKFMAPMERTNVYQCFSEDESLKLHYLDDNSVEVSAAAAESRKRQSERKKAALPSKSGNTDLHNTAKSLSQELLGVGGNG